jgi:hypothetical protein
LGLKIIVILSQARPSNRKAGNDKVTNLIAMVIKKTLEKLRKKGVVILKKSLDFLK